MTTQNIKTIFCIILHSFIIVEICHFLESSFLFDFLKNNLSSALITILAINSATLGFMIPRIHSISAQYSELNFSNTFKQMKLSIAEQIILLGLSLITLVIFNSKIICFEFKSTICFTSLVAIGIYSIYILWDINNSIFVLIDLLEKN
jgi:hypothetical protein